MMTFVRPLVALALVSVAFATAAAQQVSVGLGGMRSVYGAGEYGDARGDWQGESVLRFQARPWLRVGLGAEVGKFDDPSSDPSFTSVGVFVEPSWTRPIRDRWNSVIGVRYGWAHERVGRQADGLWAWGWEAGALGGAEYKLRSATTVAFQATATRLQLRRDEDLTSSLARREGWRFGMGAAVRFILR